MSENALRKLYIVTTAMTLCILQGKENKPVKLLLVNFFSLLQTLVGQGRSFEELLQAAVQQHPASFHLFVYADEVNPGKPLAPDPTSSATSTTATATRLGLL